MAADNEIIILDDDQKEKKDQNDQNTQNEFGQDEFVLLEELAVAPAGSSQDAEDEEEGEQKGKKKLNKKMLIIIAAGGGVILLLLIVLITLLLSRGSKKEPTPVPEAPVTTMPKQEPQNYYEINKGRIEEMIAKANVLYDSGNRIEALKIYENVAIYNESLSYYNLGVSQMNQEKFDEALENFKKAISNQEHTDVSALNAAVCALHLNNTELFRYYIDLARAFLTPNSSAYIYYSALVNYYKGYYIEAYHILNSIKDGFYANNANYLKSKILSLIRRDKDAIAALDDLRGYNTNLPMGLLHARLGNYDDALYYLNRVDPLASNIDLAKLARSLVQLKIGTYMTAAEAISEIHERNATFVASTYPIKAGLKDDYFNINAAQKNFDEKLFFHKNSAFSMLFYYTPYKVFDAKQTIDYIAKGGVSAFVSQSVDADEYLRTSGIISRVNASLSKTIEKAINSELRVANKEFLALVSEYPGHAILQYDLALSYAQLGDYANAYKHFVISYHLNPKNHLAGVYAVLCAQVAGRDYRQLYAEVSENITNDETLGDANFYNTLLLYLRDNSGALTRWLDEGKDEGDTLKMVFSYICAMILNRKNDAKIYSKSLLDKLPNDILTNILHFLAHNEREDIKEYAKNIQIRFLGANFDLNTLYGGSNIVKEQFVKLLQISGLSDVWRGIIISDLKKERNRADEIRHALAYIDLFTNRHDEAFEIYNYLVHTKKEQDAYTLFLAAVASIGSNRPQNAVAYLELAKLTNPTDPGNKIALGFLYHELGNIPAAVAQYISVGNTDYKSRFFTFHLVN